MALDTYDRLLAPARERFSTSIGVQALQANKDPAFMEAFLAHFCALGSRMTEPVERWINAAAARCADLGLSELARGLHSHARAEAGHHLMMIDDVNALAARWNARYAPKVDAKTLLDQPPSPGVLQYCALHEANIDGDTPYAQLAIEYEVELLPVRHGALFIERCVEVLSPDILGCLSFVAEHIVLDAAHSEFNGRTLDRLLDCVPGSLPALVAAGTAALGAYAQFLADCARLAERQSQLVKASPEIPRHITWRRRSLQQDDISAVPDWLHEARSLRAFVLFADGRRPHFQTAAGRFADADPLDLNAEHILAYDGEELVGCIRAYRLRENGPRCVTEQILGAQPFADFLNGLGVSRGNAIEISRWIVHPEYRANGRRGAQLAAAAAAAIVKAFGDRGRRRNAIVCTAGTGDGQDLTLGRIGLDAAAVSAQVIRADHYNDDVRIMYCTDIERLNPRFRRLMEDMSDTLGLPAR